MYKKFLMTLAFFVFALEISATNFDKNGNFNFSSARMHLDKDSENCKKSKNKSHISPEEVLKFNKKNSEKEDLEHLCNLGVCYLNGTGVERNFGKAFKYLVLTAEKNYAPAQFFLGNIHRLGLGGLKPNNKKAVYYYEMAAKQNHKKACLWLAHMYCEGLDGKQNHMKALEYFTKAADLGEVTAVYNLGVIYENGQGMEERDYRKAYAYYLKAAQQGYKKAQKILAELYIEGFLYNLGIKNLDQNCFPYVKVFADKGNIKAQGQIGYMYEIGIGVAQNSNQAFHYYHLAAAKNHVQSQYNLAILYYTGKRIKKNYKKAFKYFSLAESNNELTDPIHLRDLQVILGDMYRLGQGVDQNYSYALLCYQTAEKKGSSNAMIQIGYMYENGLGVKKNPKTALIWYIKAIKIEHQKCYQKLQINNPLLNWDGGTPEEYSPTSEKD